MTEPTQKKIVKRPEGRPTKYIPGVIFPKIEEYIQGCGKEQMELPTVEGLALKLGVNTDTVYEWDKKYPEFSDTIKKILMKQKLQLMNDGMYGGKEVNQAMAIFLLKVNHGMKDAPQVLQQFNVGSDSEKNTIVFVNFKNGTES
jgi:hypothetical protein